MFFPTPSSKEHTMKRTATALVAVVLVALSLSAVASAKTSPRAFHGGSHSARAHVARHAHPARKVFHGGKLVARAAARHHHAM